MRERCCGNASRSWPVLTCAGACRRHLFDLKAGKARGLRWDRASSDRAIAFFSEVLRLNSGEFEGQPFILLPWQAFVVGSLFGWKREDGYRRFRRAFVEAGKGCGKTPLAAGIGLYMLCADQEFRAEIYVAAYNQDQAKVMFRDAVAMVQQSPDLSDRLSLSGGQDKDNIAYARTGSFFRPISSERQGRGKSGPKPHCALLDEVHEHPTPATVEFLAAGVKARKQPLTLMITNSGSDKEGVCWGYHEYSRQIAEATLEDDAFFSYVCALDEGEDPFLDEACWEKANPSLPVVPGYDYLRHQVRPAREIPSQASVVRRLNFCQWRSDGTTAWVLEEIWRSCQSDDLDLGDYEGAACVGGLDLSLSSALTALVLAFEAPGGPERAWDVFSWFWMPGDRLSEFEQTDGMGGQYQAWRDAGHLFAPSGSVIDYAHVASLLAEMCGRFDVRSIAYDRAKVELLKFELDKIGSADVPLIEHGQGFYRAQSTGLWMPASIDATEAAMLEGRLRVSANPVLTMCVANTLCKSSSINPTDRFFDKRKSGGRIDGSVALVQAIGAACYADPKPRRSIYNDQDLFVI